MTKKKRNKPSRTKKRLGPRTKLTRADAAREVYRDEHVRVLQMSPLMQDMIQEQRERFREKFGRDPGPHDPIFFDPDADEPSTMSDQRVSEAMAEIARQAGIREAQVYAIQKTGMMIVHGFNDHLFNEQDREEWQAAIDEFNQRN